MYATLFCVKGPCEGREFAVGRNGFIIGRSAELCSLTLNSSAISRSHVNIFVAPDGRVVVQDLQSTNGTYLLMPSGERIRLRGDTAVSDGQKIALGQDNSFVFEVRTAARTWNAGVLQSFKNTVPVRKVRALIARTPKRARKYALIGFLCGIPLSYSFQSPLMRKALTFIDYMIALPRILFEALFFFKTPEERALENFVVGDVVAVLFTVCIVCALIGGFAGYYVDQSRRRRR